MYSYYLLGKRNRDYEDLTKYNDPNSRQWNREFQRLLLEPITTLHERNERLKRIEELHSQFVKEAIPIVSTIIEELSLSNEEKTIKPVNVGGRAGGDKFIKNNMLFKVISIILFSFNTYLF